MDTLLPLGAVPPIANPSVNAVPPEVYSKKMTGMLSTVLEESPVSA